MFFAEQVNPVAPDVPNMFWGAVFFFLLLILMYTVCLPPVRKAMRQRVEQRQLDEESTERAHVEAEHVRRDYEATLAEARAEAGRIVEAARAEAEAARTARLAVVDTELSAARQEVMAELDGQRARALDGLKAEVAELATTAASRVVQKPLEISAQQSIIDDFVASATKN